VTDEAILNHVTRIVAAYTRRDEASLSRDTTFKDLGVGSLDIVQMLFVIEDTFDVYVPTEHLKLQSATLGDICDGVRKLIAAKHV
jgi:acyl carrier protein